MILQQFKNYVGDAIIHKEISYSYENLVSQIEKYNRKIKSCVDENDVVIIDADYSFYSISLLLALSDFPCIIVPIVKTTETEFNTKLLACGANRKITLDNNKFEIIKIANNNYKTYEEYHNITAKKKSGIVLFSSGTTGVPKVMVHDFSRLIKSFKPPRKQKNLRFLLFLMFDHIGGLNTLLSCLNNGMPIIIPEARTST